MAYRLLLLVLLAAAVGGCATVESADGTRLTLGSPAFRDYVERVFREQNGLADRLAFALADLADASTPRARELAAAETSLEKACAPLNRLALARRDRISLGPLVEARLARRAPECEAALAMPRRLLDEEGARP